MADRVTALTDRAAGAPETPDLRLGLGGPRWAWWLALGLVVLGALLNLGYLWNHCPLDLTEDESHYWEWSRHLDYGYYSKGPGIAWLMALTCQIGRCCGMATPTAALIRTPAVLLSVITGLTSMGLAWRIFRDSRAALAVTVLSAAAPMFVVGALLLTIDAPMYCCWALATYCLWRYVEAGLEAPLGPPRLRRRASEGVGWLYLAGLLTGVGILFKPVLIALPLCAALAAWVSPTIRQRFKTWHAAGAVGLSLLMQAPILIWNAQHNWVTFRHLGGQAGIGTQSQGWYMPFVRLGAYIGGQAGGLGGILFVLLVLGAVTSLKKVWGREEIVLGDLSVQHAQRGPCPTAPGTPSAPPRETWLGVGRRFLLCMALPLWLFYAGLSLWANTEPNWPAASYFGAMVLLGGIVAEEWRTNRVLRWAVRIAVCWGVLLAMVIQHTEWFYPLVRPHVLASVDPLKSRWNPNRWDPTLKKLRAMEERGQAVERVRRALVSQTGRPVLVVSPRYDLSSSLAFYLPEQPFVFCRRLGGRHTQYDIWPGLSVPEYAGRDMLLVVGSNELGQGQIADALAPAFERVDPAEVVPVIYDGMPVGRLVMYRCYGFKGWPAGDLDSPY